MDVKLLRQDLWQQFSELGNEMIITKRGRNMFPTLQYRISGLEPDGLYTTSLLLMLCDEKKYRFLNGQWDRFDPCVESTHQPREVFVGNARTGHDLMKRGISFDKIKITNADDVCCPNREVIRVQSMRKYIPILTIYKMSQSDATIPPMRIAQFRFEETQFVAVTAYQNSAVKDLKVQNNKYALGFRENVQKRPSTSPQSYTSSDESTSPPAEKRLKFSPESHSASHSIPIAPFTDYTFTHPPPPPPIHHSQPFFDPSTMFTPYFPPPAYYECFNAYNPWNCHYS